MPLNKFQENYLLAQAITVEKFNAIPADNNDNEAEWDAYDDAKHLEREAGKQLISWGKGFVATQPMKEEDRKNVDRLFELAEESEYGKTFKKLCDWMIKIAN